VHRVDHFLRLRLGVQFVAQATQSSIQSNNGDCYVFLSYEISYIKIYLFLHSRAHLCSSFLKSSGISLFESIQPGILRICIVTQCNCLCNNLLILGYKIVSNLVDFRCVHLHNLSLHQDGVDVVPCLLPILALTNLFKNISKKFMIAIKSFGAGRFLKRSAKAHFLIHMQPAGHSRVACCIPILKCLA
jgi:ABC-type transport system involved in multi-copper enzyme maturation permease subunit